MGLFLRKGAVMKLCKDCKHVDPEEFPFAGDAYWTCRAPQAYDDPNLQTGTRDRTLKFCNALRSARDVTLKILWMRRVYPPRGYCGKEGHWFERKD